MINKSDTRSSFHAHQPMMAKYLFRLVNEDFVHMSDLTHVQLNVNTFLSGVRLSPKQTLTVIVMN